MSPGAVKTIVVLMQENRSFDHMLGYLSLAPWNRTDVDGLCDDTAWRLQFGNPGPDGTTYFPMPLADPAAVLPGDPVHDRGHIARQMGPPAAGTFPMTGFVGSCADEDASKRPIVMGYFNGDDLPVTNFFAENFTLCDRWFSAVPASTQPNRLMLMAGETMIDNNQDRLPKQPLVYDWLRQRGIRWRVYHESIPFFALMPEWIPEILADDTFREFNRIFGDIQNEPEATFPQVIFLEPRFTDAPHLEVPNDDHAPSAVTPGQDFLAQAYAALTANPDRWQGTVLVVMYDEHGGFFDHVSPPANVTTPPPAGAAYPPFTSLGPRVPAFVISPLVAPRTVFRETLDHTSVLKFIADTFAPGQGYSPAVDARPVASVSRVLAAAAGVRTHIPVPPAVAVGFGPGFVPTPADANQTPMGFGRALDNLRAHDRPGTRRKFPKLAKRFRPDAAPEPPPAGPWESGLQGARANLWPGLALQALALLLVGSYYGIPAVHAALAGLMEFRGRVGLLFPIVSTAVCGGLLPYLYMRRSARYDGRQGAFLTLFWAYKGVEVDLIYRLQAHLFGAGHDAATIGLKAFADQFIYCPLLAVPNMAVAYQLMESRFQWGAMLADWRQPGWYQRRVLPVLISNLGVWLPAVAIIYLLPTPLQLPLENLVLCFYSLVVAHQARSAPVAVGPVPGPA